MIKFSEKALNDFKIVLRNEIGDDALSKLSEEDLGVLADTLLGIFGIALKVKMKIKDQVSKN